MITGSNGKTTLMNLVVSQLKNSAVYSHHANSSYGIPFNILGLSRESLFLHEWIFLFLATPFRAFSKISNQNLYVVEADCDRPFEGKFLSSFLNPEVTIWLSSSKTHSMNFDKLVEEGKFKSVEEAIAFEYGYFLNKTSKLAIINSDSDLIEKQMSRTKASRNGLSKKEFLDKYEVSLEGSVFKIKGRIYKFKYLLPEAVFSSIAATIKLMDYLKMPADLTFGELEIPPGRSGLFKGFRNTTIIDSCYNSNLSSATEIINMFTSIKAEKKWAVIGDMLEQGKSERTEHEKLSDLIIRSNYDRVVLLGPRIIKHGLSKIKRHYADRVVAFTSPRDVLEYLKSSIEGEEVILFKGARFLEGVIENLLLDKNEAKNLSRREEIWEIRRKKWGL